MSAEGASLPTFDQLAGREEADSFQLELVSIFQAYFGSSDLVALKAKLREFGQAPTRAILMFGPSGSGKTYLVRSFAGEYQRKFGRPMPIYSLRLDKVMDKYVGETEKIITRVFDKAMRTQPSIIFADEVDALGASREGVQDYKVSQMTHLLQEVDRLTQMNAVPSSLFFACTNRLWAVDTALMRRFDRIVPADLPGEKVRQEIFEIRLNALGASVRPTDIDLGELARASLGMAPGDIDKAIRRAADRLLVENSQGGTARRITRDDIMRSLKEYSRPEHVQLCGCEARWTRCAALGRPTGPMSWRRNTSLSLLRTRLARRPGICARVPELEWFREQTYDFSWLERQ